MMLKAFDYKGYRVVPSRKGFKVYSGLTLVKDVAGDEQSAKLFIDSHT